ncbi:hypothetical protein [uncultured Paraburkholderia sp.]|uniref:hypothetical protein n=1 Tax=uncultured Paraburkholderia sp. TaxID=1822466 RepID=UPI0025926CA3|nr:hypothetical protein [uncultured Paraburkholderia sp.]
MRPRLGTALCDERSGDDACGIGLELIAQFDAVPLKYFKMLNGQAIHEPGRTHALKRYVIGQTKSFSKDRLFISRARGACLVSTRCRTDHCCSVGACPITCTANIGGSDDIAQETMVSLDRGKLTIKSPDQPPLFVAAWMDRFRRLKLLVNFVSFGDVTMSCANGWLFENQK